MSRFRKMKPQEVAHWKRTKDKIRAVRDINRRREDEGDSPHGIPYYVTGARREEQMNPIYSNGRLLRNRFGQTRHYLDWEIADLQSSKEFGQIVGFNEWRNTH